MNLQAINLLKYIGIFLFILGVLILAALIHKYIQNELIVDKQKNKGEYRYSKTRKILLIFAIIYIVIGFLYLCLSAIS